MPNQYVKVTELPGNGATAEEVAMVCTRYHFAAGLAKGKTVLEVACGPGMGLGLLDKEASRLVAGDYDPYLLGMARAHYQSRVPLVRLDARALPFHEKTFDLVILFEAIYYLGEVGRFLAEVRRVLRDGGIVLICSANKERHGFRPSPFSVFYLSASELRGLLADHGFVPELFGAFPIAPSLRRSVRSAARRVADALHLSSGIRTIIKRSMLAERLRFPAEVPEAMNDVRILVPLQGTSRVTDYQVVYAVGYLR